MATKRGDISWSLQQQPMLLIQTWIQTWSSKDPAIFSSAPYLIESADHFLILRRTSCADQDVLLKIKKICMPSLGNNLDIYRLKADVNKIQTNLMAAMIF